MTIQWGDTGRSVVGTLKKAKFTYPPANANTEELLATPLILPGTEPATPQAEFTLTQEMFPTCSVNVNTQYTAIMVASGKNTNSSSKAASYKATLNGVIMASGNLSTASANYFYSANIGKFYGVKPGDKISISLWDAGNTGLINYDYKFVYIMPASLSLSTKTMVDIFMDVAPSGQNPNRPKLGNPTYYLLYQYRMISGQVPFPIMSGNYYYGTTHSAVGFNFQADYGENTTYTMTGTSSTYRPQYTLMPCINSIEYREIDLPRRL